MNAEWSGFGGRWPGFKMKSEAAQQQQVVNVRWHPFHDRQGPEVLYWFIRLAEQYMKYMLLVAI